RTLRIYLDGVLQSSMITTGGDGRLKKSKRFRIARTNFYTPFKGIIDEVAVYNRALTPQEITALVKRWEKD
ncbi:MAG: LamG-like jellyroll fold domain-containing protein, partial [Candidatus Theseobacter exili]|nr:LamG-like jellyroll fold domain-containing protein [Candidatus Theseobacter exili]